MNILEMKVDILCSGVRLEPGFKSKLSGYGPNKRASLSEGRCFVLDTGAERTVVNAPVHEKFVERSRYYFDHARGSMLKHGKAVADSSIIGDPDWYSLKLGNGTALGRIFQLHGEDVLALSFGSFCVFKAESEGCLFCGLTQPADGAAAGRNPDEIAEGIIILESRGLKFSEININAGTPNRNDKGAGFYLKGIRTLGAATKTPIAAQICPIEDTGLLSEMKESGLRSISFNIEIFSDSARKEMCPGKAGVPVETYLSVLRKAVEIFGKNNVSSWLIAGLEPVESTIKGIEAIADTGAVPFLTVFRPIKGTPLENRNPPSLEEVMPAFRKLNETIGKKGMDPARGAAGCARCGCCTGYLKS